MARRGISVRSQAPRDIDGSRFAEMLREVKDQLHMVFRYGPRPRDARLIEAPCLDGLTWQIECSMSAEARVLNTSVFVIFKMSLLRHTALR